MAIYAVLVQNIALEDDIIMAIWSCVGYTVLLCFYAVQNRQSRQISLSGALKRKEVSTLAYVPVPKDLTKSQNKGHVQSDQAAAYLLHGRSAYWRTAFPLLRKPPETV